MDLTRYLKAIDIAASKEKRLLEIQIHQGYRATIERYLENSTVLDLKELMCILSLYSVEDLEPVDPIAFDELRIVFVPQARVKLVGVKPGIHISFVPQARVKLSGVGIKLTHVPQARVTMSGLSARITFVPQARVSMVLPVVITHVPQARVRLSGVAPLITFVPQARVRYLSADDPIITFVPQARVTFTDLSNMSVFYGVVLGNQSTRPTAEQIDFGVLWSNTYTEIGSELAITYPLNQSGWMVFAIPQAARPRLSWWQDINNRGNIGGLAEPVNMANFWPDPVDKTHQNISYRLYISKMRSAPAGNGLYLLRDYSSQK